MPVYLQYYFWLIAISLCVFGLERAFPRKKGQEVIRDGFLQDLFWLVFNVQYASWMLALGAVWLVARFDAGVTQMGLPHPESIELLGRWPWWSQFVVFFLFKDFLEWNIHRLLHTVPWLWRFHKLHHSIEQMDWIGAFRAHWTEMVIYKVVLYLPLVLLGVDEGVVFAILVCSLLIQELVHANLPWSFGPLRYVITSPRYHAWHHDVKMYGKGGQNFAVNIAIWDWVFGTAYYPGKNEEPERYGFQGMKRYPKGIWGRLWDPFMREKGNRPLRKNSQAEK